MTCATGTTTTPPIISLYNMKRLLLFVLFSLASLTLAAQSSHHLSIGAGTGLDATSFEVATNLGNHVQVRLGYGTAFGAGYTLKGSDGFYVPEDPTQEDSRGVNLPFKFSFARNDVRLLFNLYPSAKSVFHFTLGAYMGAGSFFKGEVKGFPAAYNSAGWDVGGGHIVKPIDSNIRLELRAFGLGSPDFAVLPYAGLGFGRPVRDNKRVTFSFDLGAAYQGTPSLWARSVTDGGKRSYVDITNNDEIDLQEVIDEYGKYLNFWPVINFHLYVKLF